MSVYDYIDNENEIIKFKEYIIKMDNLIDYHNRKIKELKDSIKIYDQIIDDLELGTFKYY